MTWTIDSSFSGSQALTIGTETILNASDTTNGTYVLELDLSPMQPPDLIEARIYTMLLSGGTNVPAFKGAWAGVQESPAKISFPVASDQSIMATLMQRSGNLTISSPVTGTCPYGGTGTGQTYGGQAITRTLGGGGLTGSVTSVAVQMLDVPYTCTFTNSSPTVSVTNKFAAGQPVRFWTTGVLPTPLVPGALYFVIAANLSTSVVNLSATPGGTVLANFNTAGQSGTHTLMACTAFGSSEAVYCTTGSNTYSLNAAPAGRTISWKLMRI